MTLHKLKIAYITAGAAGMYCGSCLHDNALARELIRAGHDSILIPVYTPIRTDDRDVSIDQVFMGGLNVYLQQIFPWLAYTPRWFDSLLNHPSLIRLLTKNAGKTSPKLLGALTRSMLRGTEGRLRKEFSRLLDWLEREIRPDTILFTNLLIGGCIPEMKSRLGSRVFVTLQGDDIFLDYLRDEDRGEVVALMRRLVPHVDGFLLHSEAYAKQMAELLEIPTSKIHVVPLGIATNDLFVDRASPPEVPLQLQARGATHGEETPNSAGKNASQRCEKGMKKGERFNIGYFARMAPEKGLHRLVEAFVEIASRPGNEHVHLQLAGWMGPQHVPFWEETREKLLRAGLEGRWEYVGSIDRSEKSKFLAGLDLFCVPTTYQEPKGLFLLEGVASGIPYLQPAHGAFPEMHQRFTDHSEGATIGKLFDADSIESLIEGLQQGIDQGWRRYQVPTRLIEEIDIRTHAKRVEEILVSRSER